jgi:tRNA(Ile)-lysidine synthase
MLETVEPRFKANVLRMTEVLRGDQALLDMMTESTWKKVLVRVGADAIILNSEVFLGQPIGMQRRVLRRAYSHFQPGLIDIGFEAVERTRLLIAAPPSTKQSDLIQGLRLSIEGVQVSISRWTFDELNPDWPQLVDDTHVLLPSQGSVLLPNGWTVSLEKVERSALNFDQISFNSDPYTAYLDVSAIENRLVLRTRQDGDRYQPLGMDGRSIKLSDLMVNTKLPRQVRAKYPLVCAGHQIVWVPGMQPADFVRVTDNSKVVLKITFLQP